MAVRDISSVSQLENLRKFRYLLLLRLANKIVAATTARRAKTKPIWRDGGWIVLVPTIIGAAYPPTAGGGGGAAA
jgi:hypothetical protein